MGLKHREYLAVPATAAGGKVLGCKRCRTHLTTSEQIESKVRPLSFVRQWSLGTCGAGLWIPRCTRGRTSSRLTLSYTHARRTLTGSTGERTSSRACRSAPLADLTNPLPPLTPASVLACNRVNVALGPPEDRSMTTGLHTVRDVMCAKCGETLGWKYGQSASTRFEIGSHTLRDRRIR